ncbi:MAG TPA: hypothetical protein VMG12_28690 [Polyangiaceae bacterium]|nr:hypothetical protein [Polyangiaceae bacterium]
MKNRIDSVGALLALLVSGSAACATEAVPPTPVLMPAQPVLSYRYDGSRGSAQVTRELGAGGFETLTGTLALTAQQHSAAVRSSERVAIDGAGRLQRAEIAIEQANSVDVFTLDPSRGSVRIERAGSPSIDWAVPQDAPWVYTPAALGDGSPSMTPVSSWVALRAANGAATVVRVLDPEHQTSYLAPIDQVAVPTELGTTVTFGGDAVDADARFITELRLSGGALKLARAGSS